MVRCVSYSSLKAVDSSVYKFGGVEVKRTIWK